MSEPQPIFRNALSTVKCPSCKEELKPPTTICTKGHTLCSDCRGNLALCPTCQTELLDAKQTTLDQVLSCVKTTQRPIKDLVEILKCPVCYYQLSQKCHTCLNGHAVCMSCFTLISWCPVCREGFIGKPNVSLSAILGAFETQVSCINNQYGCDYTNKYDMVWLHESLCRKRRFRCQAVDCNWEGEKHSLVNHVEREHTRLLVKRTREYIKFKEGKTQQKMIKSFNESFWIMYEFTQVGLSVGLQIIGSKSKARKYRLNLKCIGKFRQSNFTILAVPIYQNLLKNVKEKKCLFIPKSALDTLGPLAKAVCNVEKQEPVSKKKVDFNMVAFSAIMIVDLAIWASRALFK